MWKNIKTSNYRYLLIVGVVILLLLAGICGWWYYESSRAGADYHDVNSGLERIEDRKDLEDIFMIRKSLECQVAALAAKNRTEEQLKQLEVLQTKLERTEKSLMNATTSLTEVKKSCKNRGYY